MLEYLQVVTTFPSPHEAESAAEELVRRRLVACAQVAGPITSFYHWEGKLDKAAEWTCTLKTRTDKYDEVAAALHALHPYETPEIIALPIVHGDEKYLRWIDDSLAD